MPQLLYIHGFLSSPQSYKAQQIQQWLVRHHPDIHYCCPALTPHPDACAKTLIAIVEHALACEDDIYLMGSSMGGFWASYLAEKYHLPAVLINPAVDAMRLMPHYLYQELNNYHTSDVYTLNNDDLAQLSRYDTAVIQRHQNYWLLLQTGDETLDYRLALNKYPHSRQTVEEGGDHSFTHFERFHESVVEFYENFYHCQRNPS